MSVQNPSLEQQRESLRKNRYLVVRNYLPAVLTETAYRYVLMKMQNGEFSLADTQVPNTPAFYGDTLTDTLLESAVPFVERMVDELLYPTYSYMRMYKRGDQLAPHNDRPSCEVSMTLCLGYDVSGSGDPDFCWPICVDNSIDYSSDSDKAGRPAALGEGKSVCLKPGDGVIYYGTEVRHWRNPFPGERHAQVFFHFVRRKGPYAESKFDYRPMLGASHTTREPPQE